MRVRGGATGKIVLAVPALAPGASSRVYSLPAPGVRGVTQSIEADVSQHVSESYEEDNVVSQFCRVEG